MPDLAVRNRSGEEVGTVSLGEGMFAATASDHLVWEVVNHYLDNRRVGTASTKDRVAVRGGGRKPWRQKGTGRARAGSIRSPLWRGGGTTHGPQPRDYHGAVSRKKRRVALRRVLWDLVQDGRVLVLDNLTLDSHKTRDLAAVLESCGAPRKTLIVDDAAQRNLLLASRNLPGVSLKRPEDLNAYDLLLHEHLTITRSALARLEEAFAS